MKDRLFGMGDETQRHKVTVLGDSRVGKTSLLLFYQKGIFTPSTALTIGTGSVHVTATGKSGPIPIQFWDTAGQERFRSLIPLYSRGSIVAAFVYAIDDRQSFQSVSDWIQTYRDSCEGIMRGCLIANKVDLAESRVVGFEEGLAFAKARGMPFFEVSAKTGENVAVAFADVTRVIEESQVGLKFDVWKSGQSSHGVCCSS
jgi:small GTP-binding protein